MLKNDMRYLTYNFLDAIDDDFEKEQKKSWKSKLYCLKKSNIFKSYRQIFWRTTTEENSTMGV